MSFVNELFERLSKSTTANDVQEALTSLGSIQDPNERARAANETVSLIEKYARELLERGQYKNAAYQYFSGAQLIQRFLSDPNSENQWLRASADALTKASQEHISWDDLLGGAACMAIASLLKIQTGDWNVNQHLDAFIKNHDFSANQAATACLYIPYDLAGAVNPENPNPSSLQRASNYVETYLLNTKPAAMFHEGIRRAVETARQQLIEFVKFPKIRAVYEYDHDIIFGEQFKFIVKLENIGEGIASGISAVITIPTIITTVSGSTAISVPQLESGAHTQAEFTLLCSSGEGKEQLTVEVPTNVEYQDILMNKNSISLGSATITIRSEKRASILLDQLRSLEDNVSAGLSPLKSLTTPEIQPVIAGFDTILTNIVSTTKNNIQEGDFSAAKIGIKQLEQMQGFTKPLAEFMIQYSENSQKLVKNFQIMKENTETLVKSLNEIEQQLSE
ncbi:MAG: hypothetical protein ACFFFH_01945 [Candidatus Thorarchaeota archaeon]